MHFIYSDPSKNRLHQILIGTLDHAGAIALVADAERELTKLRPGFEIISDLRDLRNVEDDAEADVRNLMERCAVYRPSLLIRVLRTPSANFGFTIMSYFHYPRATRVITCGSLEEASVLLASEPVAS